jgi:outer membrane biosynthesis protein TonB
VVLHAAAIAALLASIRAVPRSSPPTYAVELVAAPAPSGAQRSAPEVAPAAPKTAPKTAPKPAPAKAPPRATAKTAPAPRATSRVTPIPGETPSTGSDIANVNLQGKQFPFPEYLRNLVTQIYRRWNRPVGNGALEAEVGFVILRDGTVREIKLINSSRSYSFDLEAQGAIEAAAQLKAFGPLPAGYPADYLQISFLFTPRRAP